MKMKLALPAAAAVMILVALGGTVLWPGGDPGEDQWWLQPPTAWAKEVMTSLDRIETLVHREQFVFVPKFGSTHTSGNWTQVSWLPYTAPVSIPILLSFTSGSENGVCPNITRLPKLDFE